MAARSRKEAHANHRGKPNGWWKEPFLEQLAVTGNVTLSARAVGVERSTPGRARKDDPEFDEAWDTAMAKACSLLVAEARRRAVVGVREPVIYKGELMYQRNPDGKVMMDRAGNPIPLAIRKYSDTLLIFLMKGAMPETYRDNVNVKHSGKVDGDAAPRNVTFKFIRSNRHPDGPLEETEETYEAEAEPDQAE